MSNSTRAKIWPIGAIALALTVGVAATVLISQSTEATSATTKPAASELSVLQPASIATLNSVPEEIKLRMELMKSRLNISVAGEVSEVGIVKSSQKSQVTVAAIGDDICAFISGGIGGCDDGRRVLAGQSFSAEPIGCDGYRVLGVVPDGVATIGVDYEANGTIDTTLPVTSNVYMGILDPVRTVATGLDDSGKPYFSVNIPLDSYASMNDACISQSK